MWALNQDLAARFLIQLLLLCLRKAAAEDPSAWAPTPRQETQKQLWAPGFGHCGHVKNETCGCDGCIPVSLLKTDVTPACKHA